MHIVGIILWILVVVAGVMLAGRYGRSQVLWGILCAVFPISLIVLIVLCLLKK